MRLRKLSLGARSTIAVAVAGLSITLTIVASRYLRHGKVPSLDDVFVWLAVWFFSILAVLITVLPTGVLLVLFEDVKTADEEASEEESRKSQEKFEKLLITVAMTYVSVCILYLLSILMGNDYYDNY